jgi:hypothetical protein
MGHICSDVRGKPRRKTTMTHDPQPRYDAYGLLAQMRSMLDQYDAERRDIDDVNIWVGVMLRTLEELWDVVRRNDVPSRTVRASTRYQVRACAAVLGDLCKQSDWDNARGPAEWDTYVDTIGTLRWLLQVTHKEWCPVTDKIGNACTCLAGREI